MKAVAAERREGSAGGHGRRPTSAMTTDEFEQIVKDWIATAQHPKTHRLYTEMVYQPMLEVLAYLRAERLQDVHRVRRRRRVHAPVDGAGVRHSARAGRSAAVRR